jgi:hypothetical protein
LPTYNDFREVCGIKRAYSWDDYLDLISKEVFFFTEHIFMQQSFALFSIQLGRIQVANNLR